MSTAALWNAPLRRPGLALPRLRLGLRPPSRGREPASDPSGAITMRARYYEPWTGRFLSEDPAMDGHNWYIYCRNQPINLSDFSGKHAGLAIMNFFKENIGRGAIGLLVAGFLFGLGENLEQGKALSNGSRTRPIDFRRVLWKTALAALNGYLFEVGLKHLGAVFNQSLTAARTNGQAAVAVSMCILYSGVLLGCLYMIDKLGDQGLDIWFGGVVDK